MLSQFVKTVSQELKSDGYLSNDSKEFIRYSLESFVNKISINTSLSKIVASDEIYKQKVANGMNGAEIIKDIIKEAFELAINGARSNSKTEWLDDVPILNLNICIFP